MLNLSPSHAIAWLAFRSWHYIGIDQGQSRGKEVHSMRDYELVFIVHPDQDEQAFNEVVEKIKVWITEAGGTISNVDYWGKRKLAYEIRKQNEGQYVLMKTQMNPEFIAQLERDMRYLEPVMRFLIVKEED
jgi:small subunit ribosomal protein S6